jgi:hypothetical protein
MEPESEVQAKKGQVEDLTNLVVDQGKPRCITPPFLTFILNNYLYVKIVCALGLYELLENVVASRLLS